MGAGEQLGDDCIDNMARVGSGKNSKKQSDFVHSLKIAPTGLSDGFPMGYVGSKRRMTNDSCFVLEKLEGWSSHLLRRRLREEQVLGILWVKLEMYMRCPRGGVELDV